MYVYMYVCTCVFISQLVTGVVFMREWRVLLACATIIIIKLLRNESIRTAAEMEPARKHWEQQWMMGMLLSQVPRRNQCCSRCNFTCIRCWAALSCFLASWSMWLLESSENGKWGVRVCVYYWSHSIVSISAAICTCVKINCAGICWKRPMKCRHGKSDGLTEKAVIKVDIALIQSTANGHTKSNVMLQNVLGLRYSCQKLCNQCGI